MIKVLKRLKTKGTYLNTIKMIHSSPQQLKWIETQRNSTKNKNKIRLSTFYIPIQYINIVFEGLARVIKQLNEIKGD